MTEKGFTVFNTWEHVAELRKQQRDCDDYPVLAGLEEDWAKLEPGYKGFNLNRDDLSSISESPIGALCYLAEMGVYPPPELLLALVNCFQLYESGDGVVELEEIFYGARKRSIGNHSAREKKELDLLTLHLFFRSNRRKGLSEIQIAENYVIRNSLDIDPESLLRSYRRRCTASSKEQRERENADAPYNNEA